jgi:exopolysaccharide biosynthesis polyprenyl glycosylphosphotransferase
MENLNSSAETQPVAAEAAIASRALGTVRRRLLPGLRLTIAERRVILALGDGLALNVALWVALVLRGGSPPTWAVFVEQIGYYLLLTVLWVVWATFFDGYELPRAADASQSGWCALRAGLLTAVTYLAIPYVTPHFLTSRLSSVLFLGLVTFSMPAWRVVYAVLFGQPVFRQRVLVVGAGPSGRKIGSILLHRPEFGNPYAGSGYQLVGFVDDDPAKLGAEVAGKPVLGNRHDLSQLVQLHEIDLLVIAISHTTDMHPRLFQALLECRERGVEVELMTDLYERVTGRVLVEHAGRDLSVVLPGPDSSTMRLFQATKRSLDLLAGFCGLLVLALVAPCIALANRLLCPGPLFYQQVRVGKGGQPFRLHKFRSMVLEAEEGRGAVWASEDDDRVTPVGRVLRKMRLDELPQFWNVLKGDMSVVGPRPERPEFVANLVKAVPFYQVRHAVRPGITGWAQVRYGYGSSVQDALVKLEYDLYYIRRQGVYLELSILVKTAAVILGFKGR